MKTYLFTVWRMTVLLVRRYFRSKMAIFFSVVFPLIFLFVFGSLNNNSGGASFKVAVINHSQSDFGKQFSGELEKIEPLDIQKDVTNIDDAKVKMNRSEIDSIIELPEQFGKPNGQNFPSGSVTVYYDQGSAQSGQTVASIIGSALGGVNTQLTKIQPPLSVESKSTNERGLSSFDYVFAGLLGFSLLGLGIFGPVNMLPAEKKTGALTRLKVTPLRPSQFILAYMFSSLATGLLSIVAMFLVATFVFKFQMVGSYFDFIVFALLGAISIFGIGVGLGGWARDERQAAPLSNIVTFPMMFLSGTFFPRFLMPEWLQNISSVIPLTPVVDGIRMITTEGKGLLDLGPQLGLIGIWIVIVYAIAFRVFRWD